MFEKASRLKLRFTTGRGEATIEELWDLSLTSLNELAKSVNKKLKEETEESFIDTKSRKSTELELKLEILKHVISVKLKERDDAKVKADKKSEVEFLENLLAEKKIDELKGQSKEEIESRLAALKAETV